MTTNLLKKRWIPPPLPTPKRCCTPLPDPKLLMFYPLYGGYHSQEDPICFKCPGHALMWSLSRFKKDGLGNSWSQWDHLPYFLHFVGVLQYKKELFTTTSMPTTFRESKLETAFFSDVPISEICATSARPTEEVVDPAMLEFLLALITVG
jgi:hypothetical protein